MANLHRLALATFFVLVALLKFISLLTDADAPDLNGARIPPAVLTGVITLEFIVGLGLLTPKWKTFCIPAFLAFLAITILAVLQLSGMVKSTNCGCLGRIELGASSRLLIGLGGLVSATTLVVAHLERGRLGAR